MTIAQKYDLCYTSNNGAEVWVHSLHIGVERAANLAIACALADLLGETIYLLPASSEPGTRNPDAQVGTETWEFKTNHAATGTSIDTAGSIQASTSCTAASNGLDADTSSGECDLRASQKMLYSA